VVVRSKVVRVKAALGSLSRSQEALAAAVDAALLGTFADAAHRPRTTTGAAPGDAISLRAQMNALGQV
jgi:hypothetical protein